jgi:hypothetical protein
MTTSTRQRNPRNNPYVIDHMAAGLRHSTAGALWRWRTETTALAMLGSLTGWLAATLTLTTAIIITAAGITTLTAVPGTRRWLTRRAWCLIIRHRLQRVCWETRMHTRSGRIPLVARIRPTDVGERAWLLCRAGICAEDFEAHSGEIRAACGAREARVTRNPRWSQLVTIDIIRHDTLSAKRHVRPHILTGHAPAVTIPAATVPDPPLPADTALPADTGPLAPVFTIPAWPASPAAKATTGRKQP